MSQPRPASGPGSTAQTSGRAVVDAAPAARSICTVIRRCGADGTGGPTWRTTTPRSKRGRGQQQPGDELAGGGRVDHHLAAGDPAGAVHGQRQAAGAGDVDPDAERAQRADQRAERPGAGVRVAVEGDRARRPARPPAAGTASPCRPARRRRGPGRPAGAAGPASARRRCRDVAPIARRPAAISSVSRARSGRRERRRAGGQRAEHQGAGGHRLGAGQAHVAVDRVGWRSARSTAAAAGSRSGCPRLHSAVSAADGVRRGARTPGWRDSRRAAGALACAPCAAGTRRPGAPAT